MDLPLLITSSFAMLSLLSCFNVHAYLDISILLWIQKVQTSSPIQSNQRGNEETLMFYSVQTRAHQQIKGLLNCPCVLLPGPVFSVAQVMVSLIVFKSANTCPDDTSSLEHHPGSLHA